MTYLAFIAGAVTGFITAVILYRLTAKPEAFPCMCRDKTLPLRDPVEKAAGEVH